MKKSILSIFFILVSFFFTRINAQIAAPELRCIAVNGASVTLSWIIPPDPSGVFSNYEIYGSISKTGTFGLVASVSNYNQSSLTFNWSPINVQSWYFYILASGGTGPFNHSDTLRTITVNVNGGSVNGVSNLNWNAIKTPLLPTSATTYTVSREYPTGTWSVIYIGDKQTYRDTIYRCKVFYNYKVEIADALGCVSVSNIKGDTCKNIQPPPIPILDSVSVNSSGTITMGWPASPASDVTCYVVYSSGGGFLTGIDTLCGSGNTTFTIPGIGTQTASLGYCIAAMDSCGNYSIPSVTHNSIFLSAPNYDMCSRTTQLSWTAYNNLPKGVSKYHIYCSLNGGTYSLLDSTTTTSYSHSGLIPGTIYCYQIRVWNSNHVISASSNKSCFTATGLPGPAFVYINSVNVNTSNKNIEVSYTVDTTQLYKGCTIYKSTDGINFTKLAYKNSSLIMPQVFVDTDVKTSEKNYYYKIQVSDDCNNPGVWSDSSKSIVLSVSNDTYNIFYNTLTWDDYTTWNAGVESFNIYRAVNGVFDPTPIINVPVGTKTYIDNVEDYVSYQGKFSYYVEAVENTGNIYGFMDKAKSNPADAYVEVSIFVPNAFAPKGINNTWLPVAQYVEKTDYKVTVFNRWGTKVFETTSDTEGWTGNNATDEVYVYLIEYKNARGEYVQLKGHLSLVK